MRVTRSSVQQYTPAEGNLYIIEIYSKDGQTLRSYQASEWARAEREASGLSNAIGPRWRRVS